MMLSTCRKILSGAVVIAAATLLPLSSAAPEDAAQLDFVPHVAIADGIHIDVPLDLKQLHNVVDMVRIECTISFGDITQGDSEYLGRGETEIPVEADGSVSGTHRVTAFPDDGKTFTAADHYRCRLSVHQTEGGSPSGWTITHLGEIANTNEDFHTADPEHPYNLTVSGPLPEHIKAVFESGG